MRGSHARYDPERDEQSVLGAKHELADAREPADPRSLTEGMLLDVLCRFGAGCRAVDSICVVRWRRGAFAATGGVAG
jgi:hypothetical protein